MSKIVILGAGESGAGAAVLAKKEGFEVFVSDMSKIKDNYKKLMDDHNIEWEEGHHTEEKILDADEVIKSPGIPKEAPMIQKLMAKGTPIISEIEFAGRYTDAKMICITGSNGKTTTTSLIYHIIKSAGYDVGLAGNIGKSLALQVAETPHKYYVIELSSFQLDGMYDFRADIAILLNITPDHLDRYHHDLQEYIKAKFRITQNMRDEDCFIFCKDDEITVDHLNKIVLKAKTLPITQQAVIPQGAYSDGEQMHVKYGEDEFTMFINELALQGKHNVYNSMAAALSAKIMNISNPVIKESLGSFKNIPHRLEKVAKVRGVLYINDSKATNVNSVWYALDSMDTPVVWIVGGTDKGNDYECLFDLVRNKVKALICLGADNTKLHRDFADKVPVIYDVHSAEEAVNKAYELAVPGDTVLLSPACASFDLFKNYEDRGNQFKEAVRKL